MRNNPATKEIDVNDVGTRKMQHSRCYDKSTCISCFLSFLPFHT